MASALPTPSCSSSSSSDSSCSCATVTDVLDDYTFDTIADLRAYSGYADNIAVDVLGQFIAWDGQGGRYIFQSDSTDSDDGITRIRPSDIIPPTPGRWHKHV